jgi:hypothetical protein
MSPACPAKPAKLAEGEPWRAKEGARILPLMELRPTWIAVTIVTCVLFGSAVNRCLGGKPRADVAPVVVEEGQPFVEEKGPGEGEAAAPAPTSGDTAAAPAAPSTPPATPAPAPAPAPPAPAAEERPKGLEDYADVTFDTLGGYKYEVHEKVEGVELPDQIPASIKELRGKKVAVRGFMLPYKNDGEVVTEFILLRNQGLCCFGTVPRMNEWIFVKMAPGKGAPWAQDIPLTVFGTLDVGEVYEKSALMSLYRMEATTVLVPTTYR